MSRLGAARYGVPSTVRVPGRVGAPALGPEWAETLPARGIPKPVLDAARAPRRGHRYSPAQTDPKLALESANPSRAEGAKPERPGSERTQAELEFERT